MKIRSRLVAPFAFVALAAPTVLTSLPEPVPSAPAQVWSAPGAHAVQVPVITSSWQQIFASLNR